MEANVIGPNIYRTLDTVLIFIFDGISIPQASQLSRVSAELV